MTVLSQAEQWLVWILIDPMDQIAGTAKDDRY
jgi:hypothetical protein